MSQRVAMATAPRDVASINDAQRAARGIGSGDGEVGMPMEPSAAPDLPLPMFGFAALYKRRAFACDGPACSGEPDGGSGSVASVRRGRKARWFSDYLKTLNAVQRLNIARERL